MKRVLYRDKPKQQVIESLVKTFFKDNPKVEKAVISLKEDRMNRSQRQNALLWMWYKVIGDETGYTQHAMHDVLRDQFLGYREVKKKDGSVLKVLKSTTELNVDQMKDYLNEIDMFAREWGIMLPMPEDLYYESMGIKK